MYPKGTHDSVKPSSRPKRRTFKGNQYTNRNIETPGPSSTARKLSSAKTDAIICSPLHCYRIIEFLTVFTGIAEAVVCRQCKKDIKFDQSHVRGFGFKLVLSCSCGRTYINSGPMISAGFEINRRIVLVMRLLGVGREGVNMFCSLMDMGHGISISTYDAIVRYIYSSTSAIFKTICLKAVEEEKAENVTNGIPAGCLTVSGDGTWKKRGFQSLYGVATLVGNRTGKVIDAVVKSAYCQACTFWQSKKDTEEFFEWHERHKQECSANHIGSAGKMEVDGIKEMFLRSEQNFGVKYTRYIGDGDSKTFKAVLDAKPYGDECPVFKSECVGHVEKRMGTRLRNIKKSAKLGGKGRLTDVVIKKLTIYYGLAIRRNPHSVEDMKKDIMATLDHITSTNEHPLHDGCPAGRNSWCKWRQAEAEGREKDFIHSPALPADIIEHLKPIYADLTKEDLLNRCLGGYTQNANESVNSTIWRLAPKHLNSGAKIVEIATFIAAGVFNEGYTFILHVMTDLKIIIGQHCKRFADCYDAKRIVRQDRRALCRTKEARVHKQLALSKKKEYFEAEEGLLYAPGLAD